MVFNHVFLVSDLIKMEFMFRMYAIHLGEFTKML